MYKKLILQINSKFFIEKICEFLNSKTNGMDVKTDFAIINVNFRSKNC
jgi:hypothetical protein